MNGRWEVGNPWIFRTKNSGPLEKETAISLEEKRRMIDRHFSLLQGHYGEKGAVIKIQKHVYWYTKGLPCCASFHSKLSSLKGKEALFEAVTSYFDLIEGRSACHLLTSAENRSLTG